MAQNDSQQAQKLLYEMLRIRRVEERISKEYSAQMMRCPVHLSIGQEATPVGVCSVLKNDDYAMSTHRSHAHYLAKGGGLTAMLAEIYGKASGCSAGKGGSMHLIDLSCGFLGATPIVGSTIPIGVGTALGSKMDGSKKVSVIFFGEGATEEGAFYEAVNFATLKNLAVVFVCENNLYSVYSPLGVRQSPQRDIVKIAAAHGAWAKKGDGNNIDEVITLAGEAVAHARSGKGPSLLEFSTYRWLEHCGPGYDNGIGYRTEEEFLKWRDLCPLARHEKVLNESGNFSASLLSKMEAQIDQEITEAFAHAIAAPFPAPSEMFTDIYRE